MSAPVVALCALLFVLTAGLFIGAAAKTWLAKMHDLRNGHAATVHDVPELRAAPPCSRNAWRGVPACED